MKRMFLISFVICFLLLTISLVSAEEVGSSGINWKKEIRSDKQEIKEQHQEMKQDARSAKSEEHNLKKQIQDARAAGDKETARRLENQLKAMHRENVQEKKQDHKELRQMRHELRDDIKDTRKADHHNQGVRDHGQGIGQGKGQGPMHRNKQR